MARFRKNNDTVVWIYAINLYIFNIRVENSLLTLLGQKLKLKALM